MDNKECRDFILSTMVFEGDVDEFAKKNPETVIKHLCANGRVDNTRWFISFVANNSLSLNLTWPALMDVAIEHFNLDSIKWIRGNTTFRKEHIEAIINSNNLEIIRWTIKNEKERGMFCIEDFLKYDKINLLRELESVCPKLYDEWVNQVIKVCCKHGCKEIFKEIVIKKNLAFRFYSSSCSYFDELFNNDKYDMIEWIYRKDGCDLDPSKDNEIILMNLWNQNKQNQIMFFISTMQDIGKPLDISINGHRILKGCAQRYSQLLKFMIDKYNETNRKISDDIMFHCIHSAIDKEHIDNFTYLKTFINSNMNIVELIKLGITKGYNDIIQASIELGYTYIPNFDINFESSHVIKYLWGDNNQTAIMWLAELSNEKKPLVNIHFDDDEMFRVSCRKNYSDFIEWLITFAHQNSRPININPGINELIGQNNDRVKWIVEYYLEHNLDFDLSSMFRKIGTCSRQLLEWLLNTSIKSNKIINLSNDKDKVFRKLCENGHLDEAIILWDYSIATKQKIDIRAKDHRAIKRSTRKVTNWLFNLYDGDDVLSIGHNDDIFLGLAYCGNIVGMDRILIKQPDLKINVNDGWREGPFHERCVNGDIDGAIYIHKYTEGRCSIHSDTFRRTFINCCKKGASKVIIDFILDKWDIEDVDFTEIFNESCKKSNIEHLEFLLDMSKNKKISLDIHNGNENPYYFIATYNNYEVLEWFIKYTQSINSPIDLLYHRQKIFVRACSDGRLDKAMLIYEMAEKQGTPVNLALDDHLAFYKSCENNQIEVARWLSKLNCLYDIKINEEGKIIQYSVLNREEYALKLVSNVCEEDDDDKDEEKKKMYNEKYNKAIELLKIPTKQGIIDQELECMVCLFSGRKRFLQLPCSHHYCLHCILGWITNKKTNSENYQCCYCTNNYKLEQCVDIIHKEEKEKGECSSAC